MKEYSEVVQFSYKGELYKLFIDDNGERFYLKTDENGKLFYVNIREFIELENIFASTPYPLAKKMVPDSKGYPQYNNKPQNYNSTIKQNKKNNKKKIRLIPKVIIKEIRVINKEFSKLEIITNDNKENYHIKYIENKL